MEGNISGADECDIYHNVEHQTHSKYCLATFSGGSRICEGGWPSKNVGQTTQDFLQIWDHFSTKCAPPGPEICPSLAIFYVKNALCRAKLAPAGAYLLVQ